MTGGAHWSCGCILMVVMRVLCGVDHHGDWYWPIIQHICVGQLKCITPAAICEPGSEGVAAATATCFCFCCCVARWLAENMGIHVSLVIVEQQGWFMSACSTKFVLRIAGVQ